MIFLQLRVLLSSALPCRCLRVAVEFSRRLHFDNSKEYPSSCQIEIIPETVQWSISKQSRFYVNDHLKFTVVTKTRIKMNENI